MLRPIAALCVVAVMVLSLCGCGKAREAAETAKSVGEAAKFAADMQDGKAKIKTEDGEVEVKQEGDGENMTMTMKGEDGEEFTISGGDNVDLKGLDLEVYPGAEKAGGHTAKTSDGEMITAAFKTNDPFEKVAGFYKDKYPDASKSEMDMDGNKMLILTVEEAPVFRSVTVSDPKDEEGVQIVLSQNIEKAKPAEETADKPAE